MRGKWEPIETAPKDGTIILIAFGSDTISMGWYEDDDSDPYPWKFIDSGLCAGEFASRNGLNGARDDKYGPTNWAPIAALSLPHPQPKGEEA